MALVVGAGALLVTAVVAAIAPRVWLIANAHEETPVRLPEFAELAQRSYVYDVQGNEIAAFEIQNSQPIEFADIPRHVIDAFVAVEDNEFWQHHGVNVRSLFRATLSNLATTGPIQGASTITMQVVKNDYMAGFERDGRYKLLQVTYAVRLEKERSKEEILERYLNTVFFGQNSYGVAAAAETYFGKPVQDLTFIEALFLAGLVQAPSSYDPIINPERSRARFSSVLDRMVDDEVLTEAERLEVESEFVIPERVRRREERAIARTYYSEALRDYLLNRSTILGDTYEERYTRLYRGGLHIHTTLDPFLQARAEEARDVLPDNAAGIDAALTAIETKTGAIRAMVGGRGFEPGQNEVNLALAPSQTGSAIKMFILAAAIQAGATPDDIVDGTHPCRLPDPGNFEEPFFEIRGGVNGGVDTLRRHTVRSINCAYSRVAQIVGLHRMVDTIYRMAASPYLYRDQPAEDRGVLQPYGAMAIGANELSTLDMASGIQGIANEGVHMNPYYVEYIDDWRGERIYTHFDPGTEVLDRQTALTAIDVLKGVLTSGTGRVLADFASTTPAFGKTGTQESNWTAMFVGATPYLSTGVLVRDPDGYTEMRNIPEFSAAGVDRVQGGTFPARIWGAFMERVSLDRVGADPDWEQPAPPARTAARLFLPGVECVYEIVGYQTTTTLPVEVPADGGAPEGFRGPFARTVTEPEAPEPTEAPPPPTDPPTTPPTTAGEVATTLPPPPSTEGTPETTVTEVPTTTAPPVPIYGPAVSATTIPPDVLDPSAPLPSVPLTDVVRPC